MVKKQRIWKPRLFRLGLLLTLLVIAADWSPVLTRIENILYDARATRFHYFTPPPSDRIVHIDIDDDSVTEIGHWPWPRAKLARILDEIVLAKPKVIGFDIYFSETEDDEGVKLPDGSVELIRHDDIFAESIRRAGNVLLPVSVQFEGTEQPDPMLRRIRNLLETNLELTPDQVIAALKNAGLGSADLPQEVRRKIARAREEAMMVRLDNEIEAGVTDPQQLLQRLCPIGVQSGVHSEAEKLLPALYPRMMSVHGMDRFRLPLPLDVPLCVCPSERAVNIQKFAEVSRFSGFIDLLPSNSDGTVRTVPLLVNYRGKGLPHMALSMACALLNVNPKDIRCTPDAIILPVPDRQPVVIPSRTENSTLGRVGAIVDVPYFGKSGEDGWRTMYDFPRFEEATAHIKIGQFWAMILREESVKKNNATADMILKEVIAPAIDVPELQQYLLHVPDALDTKARLPVIQAVIKKLQADAPELFTKSEKELDEPERPLASATKALQTIARENGITQDLLARDRLDLMNRLQGKALIINWTAQGNLDHYPTPLHPTCPGGVIQGTMLNGILTRDLWRRAPHWITAALTFLVGLFATILVALLPPWRALFCTLLIMIAYGALNGIVFFDYGNLIVGAAGPLSACALVWSGLTLTNFITAARERARFRRQFSSYIDPAIVEYYEEHPELTSVERQRREMTVVFTDLAGFTTISERLGEDAVTLLNEYFGKMVPVIRENRGVVNKFLGDGLMFFYNWPRENPDHAADAVQTVLEMRKVLDGFNGTLTGRGLPLVGMRAGMTTGFMVTGDAGSKAENEKYNSNDLTVLGDRVNLAARLEGANKVFGSKLLMNQETRDKIGDRFVCRKIGKIQVKGKSEYVMCHEAICRLSEATPQQLAHADLATQIVDAFQAGEFAQCMELCAELEEKFADADFAEAYRDECTKHLQNAYKGEFSGQIVLSEK